MTLASFIQNSNKLLYQRIFIFFYKMFQPSHKKFWQIFEMRKKRPHRIFFSKSGKCRNEFRGFGFFRKKRFCQKKFVAFVKVENLWKMVICLRGVRHCLAAKEWLQHCCERRYLVSGLYIFDDPIMKLLTVGLYLSTLF